MDNSLIQYRIFSLYYGIGCLSVTVLDVSVSMLRYWMSHNHLLLYWMSHCLFYGIGCLIYVTVLDVLLSLLRYWMPHCLCYSMDVSESLLQYWMSQSLCYSIGCLTVSVTVLDVSQ